MNSESTRQTKNIQARDAIFSRIFGDYKPTSRDIFVCSYPRSGTNWMLQTVCQIVTKGRVNFEHIHNIVPWPDGFFVKDFVVGLNDDTNFLGASPHRKVIKTHLGAKYVPHNKDAVYIVVVRDPKEVIVSSFHFKKAMFGSHAESLADQIEIFVSGQAMSTLDSNWVNHTASYWKLSKQPNVLFTSYKDMKLNFPKVIQGITSVLNLTLSDAELNEVLNKTSFEHMKTISHKFDIKISRSNSDVKNVEVIRKGQHGNSSELLNSKQKEMIDTYSKSNLLKICPDFPYEEYFGKPVAD